MSRFSIGLLIASLSLVLVSGLSWLKIFQLHSTLEKERIAFDQKQTQLRQEVLSQYFKMMNSLLSQGLQKTSPSLAVKEQAQTITLETLKQLDGEGKGAVIKFLYKENLIGKCPLRIGREYCTIPGRIPVISLVGADIRKAKLRETSLNGADLRGVDLRGADLRNSDLTRVLLNKANLSGANLSEAILYGADLSDAYLRVAILQQTRFGCENSHFCQEVATLTRTDLQGTNLTDANLGRTNLVEANVKEAALVNAKLAGANLTRTSFVGADLSGANFSHYWKGSCSDSSWEKDIAILNQTDFTNANLSQVNLTGLRVSNLRISGAKTSGAILDSIKIDSGPHLGC